MQKDIRDTPLYREAESLFNALRQPGSGQISGAGEVHASPDGRRVAFAGVLMDTSVGAAPTRICLTDLATGDTRVVTFGPNVDRLPKFSPDGQRIAFLSDRSKEGDFQLYVLDLKSGAARSTPRVQGWVEYLHWSPDGSRILLGVAGHGSDTSASHGAITSKQFGEGLPSWMPAVETGDESYRWRRAYVYEVAADRVRQVSRAASNVWEAAWCGNEALAAIVSERPGEGLWYGASLHLIALDSGTSREIYKPEVQLGWLAATPSGKHLAVVEALCSDRWIVAGELRLIDTTSGLIRRVDTAGVDITHCEWRSERQLLLAGHRGLETVIGCCDGSSGRFSEVWSSSELTISGQGRFYAGVAGVGETGDCVVVGESFVRPQEIAVIRQGMYSSVKSFDLGYGNHTKFVAAVEPVNWKAGDGLEIQGWLLRPQGKAPHPLIMNVHGGPVWHWRPFVLSPVLSLLIKRGYAIFFPNPRGSSGRGLAFVRRVCGDLGGADAQDLLAGIDVLVERGVADPLRLGVTGGSYGGFMTSWLITQDERFAAAVAVAPYTNPVTEHLIGNIPHFMTLFLQDHYSNAGGKYYDRSPILHAHKVKTPTLNICGALDRCTPPEEAQQFHSALQEHGIESVLVTYPEEGHGMRKLPAAADFAARVVSWFEQHMPASTEWRA